MVMGKFKHTRQHQRQRVSRKKVIIICAISASCLIICTTLFFNLIHPDPTKATGNETDINILITPEETLVNEKSIPAPVLARHVISNSNTISAKRAKILTQPTTRTN